MGNANDCSRQDDCYRPTLYQTCDTGYTEAETRNISQQTGNQWLFREDPRTLKTIPNWVRIQPQIAYEFRRRRHAGTVHGSFTFRTDSGGSAQLSCHSLTPPTDRRCAVSLNGGESSPSATKTMQLAVVAKFRLVTAFGVGVRYVPFVSNTSSESKHNKSVGCTHVASNT